MALDSHTVSVDVAGFLYRYLDSTPKGRSEEGPYHTLADWVRPRNTYGQGGLVEGSGRYHRPACACAVHPPVTV